MSVDASPNPLRPPVAAGSREIWLNQAFPPLGRFKGLLETERSGNAMRKESPGTASRVRTGPATVPNPCLWFPSANSPACVDLFGFPLVDSSLYASCNRCTSSTSAFCQGSCVAFPLEATSDVACKSCCRCMCVAVRRAQWSTVLGEYLQKLSSVVYSVTMSDHRNLNSEESPGSDSGRHFTRAVAQPPSPSPIEGAFGSVQHSQTDELTPLLGAADTERVRRPLTPQLPSVLFGQSYVGECMHPHTTPQADQLRAEEARLAAEQRSVIPFFFYAFEKGCRGERQVVRDLWRYLHFSAARTRPLRLWKECEGCCARSSLDPTSCSGKLVTADDEQSAPSYLPKGEEGRWWGLAHMGPDGLCGCPQTAESEAAELERRKGESRVAYRERMYLLALQRWIMGNDLRAMGDALVKVCEDLPEDFFALSMGTKLLFVAGDRKSAVNICTRPNVVNALGHCPFFWSLVAFSADQSALPRTVAETLSYRAARLAMALYPEDMQAHHALLHNFLVKGYFADSLRLAQIFQCEWERRKGFLQHHIWWHIAVVYLEMHQFRRAMQLFWTQVYSPERREGWDNHDGAMQFLLRLKILHSWSVDFRTHQLLRSSDAEECCVAPHTGEVSRDKSQEVKVVGKLNNSAGDLEHDATLALREVLSRIRLQEEKIRDYTSRICGCSGAQEEDPRIPFSIVGSKTPPPNTPAVFLRGLSAVGLSLACYIAALALTTHEEGVYRSASAETSTFSACDKAGGSDGGLVAGKVQSQGRQSSDYCAETNPADEELRKLEEEVVPFLGWKTRRYQGQIWLSVAKAFKAWADGDFAASANLLEPLLRQNIAACAVQENAQHCQISVAQSERGNVTLQTQRELVEEAVSAARGVEHKASLCGCGSEESSPDVSCFELLSASREQTDLVMLIFLDAFYRSTKCTLNSSPGRVCEAPSSGLDNADSDQIETTVTSALNEQLATECSALNPSLHIYLHLCKSIGTLKQCGPTKTVDAHAHKKIACELIEKYAEEEISGDDRIGWT